MTKKNLMTFDRYVVLLLGAIVVNVSTLCAQQTLYARANGSWTSGTTWSVDGVTSCSCTPTSIDDVFTNGFLITVPTGSFSVNNLFISANVAGSISKSGLSNASITIFGELAGYTGTFGNEALAVPSAAVVTITRLNFIFNGTNPVGSSIIEPGAWGPTAPLPSIVFNPITPSTPLSIDSDISMGSGTTLTVSSGTLNINGVLQSATASANINVNAGATLQVNTGFICGTSGTNSTSFPNIVVTGVLSSSSNNSSFVNCSVLTLNPNSIFNVGFNGSNQTQGWWYQSTSPTTLNIDPASTINFNASAAQNINAQTYGNLTLSGIGSLTKTVVGNGSLNIVGNLTFNNAGITLNVPSSNQTIFNGNGAQSINGGGTVNFNGGFQLNKTGGTLTLGQSIFVQNGLTLTNGSLDLSTHTLNLSGNLNNNATLIPSTSTLSVFSGACVIGGISSTSLSNVTITPTGSLTPPANLSITGNFTNNGTFNANTGNLTFNGLSPQVIGGSTNTNFYDLTIANAVSISSPQSVSGILTVNSNTLTTGGNLTLLSTASGDGMIGNSAGTVSGTVTVQRYLNNSIRSYRYLASPVVGATVAAWKTSFPITGTFNDPSTQAEWPSISGLLQAAPSMFSYDETLVGALGARFASFPPNGSSSTSTSLVSGAGYAAFIRQTTPITLSVTGTVRQGNNVQVTVTNTGGDPTDDGWNLVGNPFPAPINWTSVVLPSGVSGTASFKDNNGIIGPAGSYVYFPQGGPSSPGGYNGIIPSGQAFWVRRTSQGSSVITFTEGHKANTRTPTFLRQESFSNILRVKLSGNGKQDELVIRVAAGALDGPDDRFDAFKLRNDFMNFSSVLPNGQKLAINGVAPLSAGQPRKELPLLIEGNGNWVISPGSYRMSFEEMESFDSGVEIYLKDLFLRDSTKITQDFQYTFSTTADPKSYRDRFSIVIARPSVTTSALDAEGSNENQVYPNPTSGIINIDMPASGGELGVRVFNALGQEIGIVDMVQVDNQLKGSYDLSLNSPGVYYVQVTNGSRVQTKKIVKR